MDLKSILDVDLAPLTDEEIDIVDQNYRPRKFDTVTVGDAVHLLKLLLNSNIDMMDDKMFMLLVRRLNMIVDFEANPELLI